MGLRGFVYILLSLSVLFIVAEVNTKVIKDVKVELPLLTFQDATMYTLSDTQLSRVIYANEVKRFKDRDVMYSGKILIKQATNELTIDTLIADIIIKRKDDYKFLNNVQFTRGSDLTLNTDELLYDTKQEILTNNVSFNGIYNNNIINGKNLYYDVQKRVLKVKNAHFEVLPETKKDIN